MFVDDVKVLAASSKTMQQLLLAATKRGRPICGVMEHQKVQNAPYGEKGE